MRFGIASVVLIGCGRMNFDPAEGEALRCDLAMEAASLNLNSTGLLSASAGYEPYSFAFVGEPPNAVTLDSDGAITAGDEQGSAIVEVTDIGGCTAQAEITIGGSKLFFVGGTFNSIPSSEVWRSSDGVQWVLEGNLPEPRYWGALVAFENRMLYLGGNDGANPRDEVYATTDGNTWTQIGRIPNPTTAFGFTVHQGRLWIAGGNGNADNVYVSDDGVAWTLAGNLPMDNHGGTLVSTGDALLYAGGHNGTLFDWVLSSPDGAAWTQVGTLAVPREYHTGVRIADKMWLVGGQDTNPTPIADVTTTSDGVSWSPIPALPVARALGPVIEFADRVWSFGGSNSAGVYSLNGGAWQVEAANLPPRQAALVARFSPQ